jgi:cobalt-zinc-cadmium resistance protein CzcA
MTLAPVLCSFLFRNKTEEKETLIDRAMKWVYLRALRVALRFRMLTLAVMAGLFAYTIVLVGGLGAEFMP